MIKVQTDDRLINQIQQNFLAALSGVMKNPLVPGTLMTAFQLNSGSNEVAHGLGRKLQGWIVVRQRGAAVLYDTQDTNPIPDKTLLLHSDSVVTVDLFLF